MHAKVKNRECARLWATQTRDHARSFNGTLTSRGPTLYSYAVPIAKHASIDGKPAVILATRRWTKTTSGHQRIARHALNPGTTVVLVHEIEP